MKLLFENWKRYLAEVEVDAPAPPEPSICDPDDEPIDFIGVLGAAISIVDEAGKPELAHVLQCLQQQIVPASEYEGGGEEDERPRPAFGSPLEKGGPVGFQEALLVLNEGGLAGHQTEPRHEGGTPEERLLNKLLIRSKVDQIEDPQRAAEMLGLGDDEEVIAYLANLMGNPMYAPMEESDDVVEGQYETGAQRAARERDRETKIRELMRTQGLSRSAAEQFAGRSYSQTR